MKQENRNEMERTTNKSFTLRKRIFFFCSVYINNEKKNVFIFIFYSFFLILSLCIPFSFAFARTICNCSIVLRLPFVVIVFFSVRFLHARWNRRACARQAKCLRAFKMYQQPTCTNKTNRMNVNDATRRIVEMDC